MFEDFADSDAFRGAVAGARYTLAEAGIVATDDILAAIASNVLKGFVLTGGLVPEALDGLRDAIAASDTRGGH